MKNVGITALARFIKLAEGSKQCIADKPTANRVLDFTDKAEITIRSFLSGLAVGSTHKLVIPGFTTKITKSGTAMFMVSNERIANKILATKPTKKEPKQSQSKSILDIPNMNMPISLHAKYKTVEDIKRGLVYTINDKEVTVTADSTGFKGEVLKLTFNEDRSHNVLENLHFFHLVSNRTNKPYNIVLGDIVNTARGKWGSMK